MSFRKERVYLTGRSNSMVSQSSNSSRSIARWARPPSSARPSSIDQSLNSGQNSRRSIPRSSLRPATAIRTGIDTSRRTQSIQIRRHRQQEKTGLSKIRDILKQRYTKRKNLHRIFKDWDQDSSGYISAKNAHTMVNRLGMECTQEEAQQLVDAFDQSKSHRLNLQDFLHMVFDDVDEQGTSLRKSAKTSRQLGQIDMIKDQLQSREHELRDRFASIDPSDSGKISKEQFSHVLSGLNLPDSVIDSSRVQMLFRQAGGDKNEDSKIEYGVFLTNIFMGNDARYDVQNSYLNGAYSERSFSTREEYPAPVIDLKNAPISTTEQLQFKARKVRRILRQSCDQPEVFLKKLAERGKEGKISQSDLYQCINEITQDRASEREIYGLLSSYLYNKNNKTSISDVVANVWENDKMAAGQYVPMLRPAPPDRRSIIVPIDNARVSTLLQKIEDRVSMGSSRHTEIFKKFDKDGDGYISQQDMQQALNLLQISNKPEDTDLLISFLDNSNNGYVNFQEFSEKIRPDIISSNAKRLNWKISASGMQPSAEFTKEISNRAQRVQQSSINRSLSPLSIVSQPQTRYGSRPQTNTFRNFQAPPATSYFSSESERLKPKNVSPISFVQQERDRRESLMSAKRQRFAIRQEGLESSRQAEEIQNEQRDQNQIAAKASARESYSRRIQMYGILN